MLCFAKLKEWFANFYDYIIEWGDGDIVILLGYVVFN